MTPKSNLIIKIIPIGIAKFISTGNAFNMVWQDAVSDLLIITSWNIHLLITSGM